MQKRHYYKLPDDDCHQAVSCLTYAVVLLFIAGTATFILLRTFGVI